MKDFYISRVGDSVTSLGILRPNAISVTAKTHNGAPLELRLLPGFDPYISVLLVRNGLLGLYRFDRRMTAMSDTSEVNGLNQDALVAIVEELCRNLLSEESGVIFLKPIVGNLTFPHTVNTVGASPIYAGNQLVFTLTQQRFRLNYAVGLGRIPVMQLQQMKRTITGIEPVFAKLFARMVRASYGRGVSVSYLDCIISNKGK